MVPKQERAEDAERLDNWKRDKGKGHSQGMSVRSRERTEEGKNFISLTLERKHK